MKKLLLIVPLIALIACQKSSLSLVKDTWKGAYVQDTVNAPSIDSAKTLRYDCPGDRKWEADTVLPYNHGEPEAVPTTWQEIHPGLMVYINVIEVLPGYYQRLYFIYDHKVIQ